MYYKMRNSIKKTQHSKSSLLDEIELMSKLFFLVTKVSFALGVALVVWYCALNRFIPDLKLEDTLVFVWVVLGFGVVMGLGLLYGSISWAWLFGIIDNLGKLKKNSPSLSKAPNLFIRIANLLISIVNGFPLIFSFILLVIIVFFIGYFFEKGKPNIGYMLLAFLVVGLLSQMLIKWGLSQREAIIRDSIVAIVAIVFMFIVMCLIAKPTPMLNLIFSVTAIRQGNVDVVLSPANFKRVKEYARVYKATFKACYRQESDTYLVQNVDLAWYGVGQKALLELKAKYKQSGQQAGVGVDYQVKIPLEAAGLRPLGVDVVADAKVSELEAEIRKDPCACDTDL